ncbi:MAG: bifunctional lysylphosphatidylglycerol flippase/synthetase MprF, partial [Desulfobacteraceae bacterium]|nr:bifunctional lysylphosphatidylglycerol flippase/synthetase MprF [Desulfobacteraceae bacterium]
MRLPGSGGRALPFLAPLLGLLVFALALYVLDHALAGFHYHDLRRWVAAMPSWRLAIALLLTVGSYLALAGYDFLAFRYIRRVLPYPKILLAAFLGYAITNNTGGSFAFLAGGSIRYRLYAAWGVSGLEIAQIIAFGILTFWLGFLFLGSLLFLLAPLPLPVGWSLPLAPVPVLGGIFLLLLGLFIIWSGSLRRPLRISGWEIRPPSLGLALIQIGFSVLDWSLAATVLYVLLPHAPTLSWPVFLGLYLLAQLGAMVSQVPGGLGVLETLTVLLLKPFLPAAPVFGALLVFRGIYYLLPLALAALLLGGYELAAREKVVVLTQAVGRRVTDLAPPVFSLLVFVGGALLLFSGATPSVDGRMAWLREFLPLPVIELSHFLGSLTGLGLLVLARGLWERLDAAFFLTALLLGAGAVFSLLKGLDYEEAAILLGMLGLLLSCRKEFYRRASLLDETFTPGWIVAVGLVLLSATWLGLFSYRHVEYSADLWWRFTLHGDAPRFLRATVGLLIALLLIALARLLHPTRPVRQALTTDILEEAAGIVRQAPATKGYLALLGDKDLLFSTRRRAFLMYGVRGRSWVAMGDPVGEAGEFPELLWLFRDTCDRYGGWPVIHEAGLNYLHLYLDIGLLPLKFGEEARVGLGDFSLEGAARKNLRRSHGRAAKEGCRFEVRPAAAVEGLLPQLNAVSERWLEGKATREKGFSLGFFQEAYLKRFPLAVVTGGEGKILAFANVLPGGQQEELSIDLMRFRPRESPAGIMDFLLAELMLWGRGQGYRWFNLGMAPLAGLDFGPFSPTWNRVGAFI